MLSNLIFLLLVKQNAVKDTEMHEDFKEEIANTVFRKLSGKKCVTVWTNTPGGFCIKVVNWSSSGDKGTLQCLFLSGSQDQKICVNGQITRVDVFSPNNQDSWRGKIYADGINLIPRQRKTSFQQLWTGSNCSTANDIGIVGKSQRSSASCVCTNADNHVCTLAARD